MDKALYEEIVTYAVELTLYLSGHFLIRLFHRFQFLSLLNGKLLIDWFVHTFHKHMIYVKISYEEF